MTVRMPRKNSLRELFDRIRHVKYAVISPWRRLPMDLPENNSEPIILTEDFKAISTLWNLTRFSERNQYSAQLSDNDSLIVTVLEKGKNVFPEIFESQIILRKILHEDCLWVPDNETWPLLRLYWKLYYEQLFIDHPEDRRLMLSWLPQKIGAAMRPRYRWLGQEFSNEIKPEFRKVDKPTADLLNV